ncbi:hypothetical protein HJP15_10250 [Pseudoalteromonas sp. NEC-BIFX-2020_002]|uniref:hypothetical protein n=1 Tax=Pseudoalteromonas sp. NEC-BIFX-2020_002 TaxID=2732353 RepID=UPI001476ECE8|nr:hypothetical protein [Pseudoalteromonas sp. NEC-BIFX-2020_002]NNG43291.1 hypothetical protein [Pseudoalteromonas sp. NEC-BIFX-2020_002]
MFLILSLRLLLYEEVKKIIRDICNDNGKPYAFDPESIECVEDLTSKSDKAMVTVAVTMKSGKTVVLNVIAAK